MHAAEAVTFLFTDIEGSTWLLRELGAGYVDALAEHRRALRRVFAAHGGVEVDTQGDAFFIAFSSAEQAVAAAAEAQAALAGGPIRVRMGLHTGRPVRTDEGYVGLDVHLGARIAASGYGGQVLLSRSTRELVDDVVVLDLGEHRVKDFEEPVWIFQLGGESFPPLKTISNTNLPRPASSFVGRESEVAELGSLLRGTARLVTLSGPGGSGKTRLAIEAASELVGDFRNGVFWVGLATIRDPELVVPTVAQTIGAQDGLAGHIEEKELLLLLDNLEQVVAVAPELAALVEACPNLKLLVTSRELLRVRGEVEYEVLPLADPDAVQLFSARAQVPPDPAIEELCRRLDNMPLALELAAARTKALSPEQILDRLGDRLDLLKGGRDAEPRQATLRATIEWSHDLLSPEELTLFRRLSVFLGGCAVEAVETVCHADLDTVQSLVEKSLVRHTGERFWMLETIREYAVERLAESGEAEEMGRRHAEFFAAFAESTGMCMESIERVKAQHHELAAAEADNFRAAIAWSLAAGHVELAAGIAVAFENFWVINDPAEGVRLFSALLERRASLPPALEARVLRCYGSSAYIFGEYEQGTQLYEQALAAYRALGDEWGIAVMLHRLAVEASRCGDQVEARRLAEDSLALHRKAGSRAGEAQVMSLFARLAQGAGEYEYALQLFEQSAAVAGEAGFRWWQASALGSLAECALELGHLAEAEDAAMQALALARQMGDRLHTVSLLAALAIVYMRTGRQERAGRVWGAIEADELRGRIGQWEGERDEIAAKVLAGATPEFEAARRKGARLSLDVAVEYALEGRFEAVRESGEVRT